MTFPTKTTLLAAALGLTASAAMAGDWAGGYVGAYGAYTDTSHFGIGTQLGYSFDLGGGFYAGPEADLLYIPDTSSEVGEINARFGYALTPDLLAYGTGGLATNFSGTNAWVIGGGFEYMMMDSLSLRVGGERYQTFGGGVVNYVAKAGLAWHF